MACYHPIKAWRDQDGYNPETKKRKLTFNRRDGIPGTEVEVPCGNCVGCRLEKSRQWACRCLHESKMHKENCFITLTYDDNNLPVNEKGLPSLRKEDFVNFMKRLRKKFGEGIRFFHCGEYGSLTWRPHHHACLFGMNFPDRCLWTIRNMVRLYRSPLLESLWPYGHSTIGDVTFESAAYAARYVMKKVTGKEAEEFYEGREPEYITMSRRPGVGRTWFDKYESDVYPHDYFIIKNGIKSKPVKYYDYIYDKIDGDMLKNIKKLRIEKIKKHIQDNTLCRLEVREKCIEEKIKKLIRTIE